MYSGKGIGASQIESYRVGILNVELVDDAAPLSAASHGQPDQEQPSTQYEKFAASEGDDDEVLRP